MDLKLPPMSCLAEAISTGTLSLATVDPAHSGSPHMKQVRVQAVTAAKRHPDMIFAGHVHNYQRLTKVLGNGTQIPHLVTGAGGYHNLHPIIKVNGQSMITPVVFNDKTGDPVTLESFSDDHHGFLRLEVTDKLVVGRYFVVPQPQEPYSKPSKLVDYFEFDWRKKR